MTYQALSVFERGCLCILAAMVLFVYMYSLIRIIYLGRYRSAIPGAGVLTIVAFCIFQLLVMIQDGDQNPRIGIRLIVLIPVLFAMLIYAFFMLYKVIRWQKEHVSLMSVKEAFDRLPTGLAYFDPDGMPVMVNEAMQRLSRNVLGRPLTDADLFRKGINEMSKDAGQSENRLIVRGRDGRIYSVKFGSVTIDGAEYCEFTGTDISTEYELTEELESRRDRERVLNSRLKALVDTIEYVTMNRELLQLKTALHDNIGQSILICKRYLYAPESVDRQRMLDFWSVNIRHLINDEPEAWELPYYVISREAGRLGISLDIKGRLPDEKSLIPIVDSAISVQVGNTLKHTGGTKVEVGAYESPGEYLITLRNDGRPPAGEIREKGGLLNLRREVESAGGRMVIRSVPEFELQIILPKPDRIE